MDNSGGRLALMAAIGFLLIEIGILGRLGSILGAIIDPADMIDMSQSSSSLASTANNSGIGITVPGGAS